MIEDLLREQILKTDSNTLISKYSNIGANPIKRETAKSLFYEAGKRNPAKYGQFLFYSLGSYENDFKNAYYRSESVSFNKSISSIASKNPSAGMLVKETMSNESVASQNTGNLSGIVSSTTYIGNIIGGLSAPYYWKDFLYCKYYGSIPNNYMITLRRFPTPVLDNMSIPAALKDNEAYITEGVGRPVAQAITWFGGNTGNSLSGILSFTTGLKWLPATQEEIKRQEAFSKGLFTGDQGIGPRSFIGSTLDKISPQVKNIYDAGRSIVEGLTIATDPNETVTKARRTRALRDKSKDLGGVMSEYIWTSVDVVTTTQVRAAGLPFTWSDIVLVFDYDLTSVGEVNSKAAMLDILANLLSIGTNYGNFLTPDIRYQADTPAIAFPGGDRGLELYYSNPIKWFTDFGNKLADATTKTLNDPESNAVDDVRAKLSNLLLEGGNDPAKFVDQIKQFENTLGTAAGRLIKLSVSGELTDNYRAPLSLLTGAPVGEWHVTVGNPCNPIAMIGNLVCDGVKIEFTESLGPDDFPTGVKATFTLKHGRERERGEIESIFNRGDGKLYQSVLKTSANAQSFASTGDVNGNVLSEATKNAYLDGQSWQKIPPGGG